jgi:hypothetical protein
MEGFPYGLRPAVVQNRAAVGPITLTLQQHHVMKAFTYKLGVGFGHICVQQKSHYTHLAPTSDGKILTPS